VPGESLGEAGGIGAGCPGEEAHGSG
jgi:hypothetical protein